MGHGLEDGLHASTERLPAPRLQQRSGRINRQSAAKRRSAHGETGRGTETVEGDSEGGLVSRIAGDHKAIRAA